MRRTLLQAVRLRLRGMDWRGIARHLGCSERACTRWPVRYRAEWQAYGAAIRRQQCDEINVTSLMELMRQLRDGSPAERRSAARLIRFWVKNWGPYYRVSSRS